MNNLSAFVGHSFDEADKEVVEKFLGYFNRIKKMPIGFTWDHAEWAEPKLISEKVKEKMEGKNLFIGICTAKENTINPSNIKQTLFNKNVLKVERANLELKTSDWILQEIGFAEGRGLKIMLLLEEGVRKTGGLQGDLQYIPFNRNDLEKPFTQILEMVTSCLPPIIKEASATERLASEEPKNIEEKVKDEEAKIEPDKKVTEDLSTALIHAMIEKDRKRVEEILPQLLVEAQNEYERIGVQARRLYLGQIFLQEDNLDALQEMQRSNSKHSKVIYYLGKIYEHFEEYGKAANCLIKAAENEINEEAQLKIYVRSAYLFARNGDKQGTDICLDKAKTLKEFVDDAEIKILNEMATISLFRKEDENYLAFLEGVLDEKPNDHDNRFSLAYKYAELGDKSYAMYHYRILTEQNPTEGAWNNMGVAQCDLKLLGKGVQAFRVSEKLGSTLSMGNIAFRFINAGFIEEAEELCGRAVRIPDFDARVASAISRINEVRTEEDNKIKEIFESIKPRRSFYVKYAHACTKESLPELSGTWRGPNCDLNVIFRGNNFEATGSYEEERGGGAHGFGLGNALLGKTLPPTPSTKVIVSIRYSGDPIGYGIPYKLEFQEEGRVHSILTGFPKEKKEGLMVISDSLDEIEVYEKGVSETDNKYYSLKKID